MKIYEDNELKLMSSIVTIGAFDGLHRGHLALIERTVTCAKQRGVPSVVYTFDPPPRSFLQQKQILMSVSEKVELVKKYGVDHIVIANFDQMYAAKTPLDFIHEIKLLHPQQINVGPNFTFGKGKQGDVNVLADHFNVYVQPFVVCEDGEIISSTRIRGLMEKNELEQVKNLLGRPSLEKIKI
ncbi:FAD synthetase [Pseudogracilibacillus auburnensis]|uniref:FAD synthase n=1 Tax=Pseudogracilibacillus auburnensis TaxID=1494959 RepID=A0A2V3VZS7_9BACI|nr:FAD synthetase family protein [Pseudogracilibacillus auburnensis]MBO1002237.1 FAD synthetase family protein [Pseudogracilibacillus auburnensis]PXW87567.1 riboflavin kinase/FMN adenylyltransferase [Pseudogracilibacillus auburnensis]